MQRLHGFVSLISASSNVTTPEWIEVTTILIVKETGPNVVALYMA